MTAISFMPRDAFGRLLEALRSAQYRCIGPQVRDGAIVYDSLEDAAALPRGVVDEQAPGHYRLEHTESPRSFAWVSGPQALKPWLFAPRESLWAARRDDDGTLRFESVEPRVQALAVIGPRACDLAALTLQDQHFLGGPHPDPYYAARRRDLFIVAVNCARSAATCFCSATGDGPRVESGHDLVLSELDAGYLIEAGSDRGATLLQGLGLKPADSAQLKQAADEIQQASVQQRRLPSRDLRASLYGALDHPRWQEVGARCLSCANCTSVCPTCFCHSEFDEPELDGERSTHARQWDSCFTQGHSYIHGMVIRDDTAKRYRQWLIHKLAAWHDQYGRSGCTGCGRCISWCPVGIDLTEEVEALSGEHVDAT